MYIPDGIFDSLNSLKSPNMEPYKDIPQYNEAVTTFEHIMKLASAGPKLPSISLCHGEKLLRGLRSSVTDYYSLSSLHFLHLGKSGILHFTFLLNSVIDTINCSSIPELNTIWASILHKGHGKDPEIDRSWRTISCCPLLAKALDTYMVELYGAGWMDVQAPTQFQGENSSHELAALCVTEAISHSLHVNKDPVYVLLLDAMSAFDLVIIEHAIRSAWEAGTIDEGLLYLAKRLRNRLTFVEWERQVMGPIADTMGVEQGGCASDRLYRLVNNEQLTVAQRAELGVHLGQSVSVNGQHVKHVISAVGQADDIALLSTSLHDLKCLIQLSMLYCEKYQVTLVGSKTKLLAFSTTGTATQAEAELACNPIIVNNVTVEPCSQAAHVGVTRSIDGNLAHIADRLSAHRKAVFALLHGGLARGHRASPAASLKVEKVYCVSVLLSGLASLVLSAKEEKLLDQHYKTHIQRLLKLHQATPASAVYFLAGCLPLTAQLHLRIFSLFGQLCRLRDGHNILADHARSIISSASLSSKSWFWRLRKLFLQYKLPHPITWLTNKPPKLQSKKVTKAAVLEFWLDRLRVQADKLDSLCNLKTSYLGLTECHPLFSTCRSSPWETEKAVTQARLLSGRARLESVSKHWSPGNRLGLCTLPDCWETPSSHYGDLTAFLLTCPSLASNRRDMDEFTSLYLQDNPNLVEIVEKCQVLDPTQFLLDCSTMAPVIKAAQGDDTVVASLFKLTRNICHNLFRKRIYLLESDI